MKTHLITILFLISLPILGQETNPKKISIGVSYSPNISYRSLSNVDDGFKAFRDNEKVKYGQSLNLIFRYGLNNHIGIESGMLLQSRGFQSRYEELIYADAEDPMLPNRTKYLEQFYYVGIPVKLTLKKEFNHISIISSIGLIGNYFLHQEGHILADYGDRIEEEVYNSISDFNRIVLSSIVGIGVEWKFTDHYRFLLMPSYQRDLTSIVDAEVKTYLWDLGLNVGLVYNF